MDEERIYGKRTSIDPKKIQDFYNKRAAGSTAGDIGIVLLGNRDPQSLDQRNAYERDHILPLLDIGPEARVLDIGCGIGRWARLILPNCKFYCGVDFSPEMIRVTKDVCRERGGDFALHCMPAAEAAGRDADFYGGRFERVIAWGVFMYINDPEAERIFRRLPELLAERCIVYLAEPVGLRERLTLKDYPSEALQSAYSAIYRTPEEYMELYAPLFDAGFSVMKREFVPNMGDHYSDTGRYYFILER